MKYSPPQIKTGSRFVKLIVLLASLIINPAGLAQSAPTAVKSIIASLLNNKIEYPLALKQARQIDPQLSENTFKTIVIENEIALRHITSISHSSTYLSFHSPQLARQEFKVATRLLKTRRRNHRSSLQTAQLRGHYHLSSQRITVTNSAKVTPSVTPTVSTSSPTTSTPTTHAVTSNQTSRTVVSPNTPLNMPNSTPTASTPAMGTPVHTAEAIAAPDLDEFVDLQ